MDFSRDCLDKNSEFGLLWYYGNKEDKISTKEVEKLNLRVLFEFIQVHKDVIEYEHWTILFKGFFVIMLSRLEWMVNKFKSLRDDLKRDRKPTISEYQLILSDNKFDLDAKLSIQPPSVLPPVKEKRVRKIGEIKKVNLIKETPNLPSFQLLESAEANFLDINQPLLDDGFGGNLNDNVLAVNVNNFFDIPKLSEEIDRITRTPPQLEYEDAWSDGLPTSIAASVSAISPSIHSTKSQVEATIARDSEIQASRELILRDQRSSVLSIGSAALSIEDEPLVDHRIEELIAGLKSPVPEEQAEEELSFNLEPLDENEQQVVKRRRKRRRADGNVIIDDQIELSGEPDEQIPPEPSRFQLAMPFETVEEMFKRPLIPHSVDLPISLKVLYSTEPRETDDLITREISKEDDFQTSQTGSLIESRAEKIYDQQLESSPVEEVVHSILDSILHQVCIPIDRKQHDFTIQQDFDYDSHIEMQRDTSTKRYFSDFEPMNVQGDFTTTSRLLDRADDSTFFRPSRLEDDLTSVQSQKLSITCEDTFSYVDRILDELEKIGGQTSFTEFTTNYSKKEAAKFFADLLDMKSKGEIELFQEDATSFSEIYIKKI